MKGALWISLLLVAVSMRAGAGDDGATITARGQAEIRVAADTARFDAAVVTTGKDASAALEENNRRVERVLAALRDTGQKNIEIETGSFSVHPVLAPRPPRAEPGWQPDIVGFNVRNRVRVTTRDLAAVGELITAANEAGANSIDRLTFDLHDRSAYRAQAIREATRNALADVRIAAEAAGVEPVKIASIDVERAPSVRPLQVASSFAAERAAVPVEPGQVTVHATVSVTMEIEQ